LIDTKEDDDGGGLGTDPNYSAAVPSERETLLAAMAELDETINDVHVALETARQNQRKFARLIAAGHPVENSFVALRTNESRRPLNNCLDQLEAGRHRVRTLVFALGLTEGLTISALARLFAFSRQLASRYAKEARAAGAPDPGPDPKTR
jgi:hypothetical protein